MAIHLSGFDCMAPADSAKILNSVDWPAVNDVFCAQNSLKVIMFTVVGREAGAPRTWTADEACNLVLALTIGAAGQCE